MKKIKYAAQSVFRPGRGSCEFTPQFKKPELEPFRPCAVGDVSGCVFHRFVDEDRAILSISTFVTEEEVRQMRRFLDEEGIVSRGADLGKVSCTLALVEYPDGSLRKVDPERVRFTDREG